MKLVIPFTKKLVLVPNINVYLSTTIFEPRPFHSVFSKQIEINIKMRVFGEIMFKMVCVCVHAHTPER